MNCLFCNENETVHHLFFDCVVAKQIWFDVADTFDFNIPKNMTELSSFWKLNNKRSVINIACVASIWGIWTMRNDMCFQGMPWTSTRAVLGRISSSLHQWKILCKGDQSVLLRRCLLLLDSWTDEEASYSGSPGLGAESVLEEDPRRERAEGPFGLMLEVKLYVFAM